ncbi:Fe-S protein assembly co-chaperone HscB [Foetidibacter luteolus]|uniref:Fe-S protein assembly co-chaperone HscB n=1 Tax=Foetidibacter luteolus TaxID=2608880 RepID=UPI00129B2CC2|nr:Fe-S protein assembly co-chaperone HscB [Foetidibacter luteolus]
MNYFELFGMPVTLNPDKALLKKNFYELSRQFHPDFFVAATPERQAEALDKSSQVNKGYKLLQNPDEVIKYVLQLKGLLQEEERYELPKEFLMEMLELNEQLMEAKMDGDENAIAKVKSAIANFETEIYEPVKQIVESYQDGVVSEKALLQVKDYYYRKKYLQRILAGLN